MEETWEVLKTLADTTRLEILKLLLTHDLCVGGLAHRLGISSAAVSQHLRVLRKAGLVRGEKRGYWTHYVVERDFLVKIAEDLKEIALGPVRLECICRRRTDNEINNLGGSEAELCTNNCQHPEKLKGKPGECTPEQIKECNGDFLNYPCVKKKKKD
ncbi:metalloregulator ArsR/SmtB family transcription factor [Moorella naiadis]|uniref:ArsR/SmtB family transcription factor n=1 Tax=Moorella naiadis (nom. illeg.) TaxID=3093670 RepID=UPI003D9C882B